MKEIHKKQIRRIVCILLVVVVAAFLTVCFFIRSTNNIGTTAGPYFVFDDTAAVGWWAGQNNFPVDVPPPEYQGDVEDLKYTTFVVFQGTKSSPGNCFVSFLYSSRGQKSEALVLDASERRVTSGYDDLSLKEIASTSEFIRIFGQNTDYVLHGYELIGSPGQDIARGMQIGYVQLEGGYIEVRSVCASPSELDGIKPVLDAIELRTP